jgi:hypothetical protein
MPAELPTIVDDARDTGASEAKYYRDDEDDAHNCRNPDPQESFSATGFQFLPPLFFPANFLPLLFAHIILFLLAPCPYGLD